MTKDEALRLALEALEWQQEMLYTAMQYSAAKGMTFLGHPPNPNEAITAIKEALAQPEQEPVAFVQGCNRGQWEIFPAKAYQIFENEQPLYTTPPQRKPLTGKMLLRAAQASLSPEQYDHFEAMSKHQPDIYDRLAYSIGVQDE